jgi:23S rRNA (adenine2503-C2)-methyltransferase
MLPRDWALLGHRGSPGALFSRIQRIATWNQHGPDLGKAARALLAQTDTTLPVLEETALSSDGSRRCVLVTSDGKKIEAVHMPRAVKNPRVTLCLSSQVGCAMGCTFCATGTMGIVRNLSAGEIVGEVLSIMRAYGPKNGHALNVVFMGMGEPLHNAMHVRRAVEVLCHPEGIGMSPNRIVVSTSGLVPAIEKFASWPVRPLLAVSVNATTDETRSRIMPVNRSYGLAQLKATLLALPVRPGERILLEYVLLRGENDTDDDAARLADFARGLSHNVNLVPLNEHGLTSHRAPDDGWVRRFAEKLESAGCLCTVRKNRGRDIRGACGQLVQSGV